MSCGILRRAQKNEALLFRKPIKNIHFKKTPFLKIINFAYFGFITLEFSDIFDPWATLFFQLPLTWNMCFLGVHNLHGPHFAVAYIMECVFLGFVLPESWWKYPTRIYWSLYFRNIVKDHRIHFCICFSGRGSFQAGAAWVGSMYSHLPQWQTWLFEPVHPG